MNCNAKQTAGTYVHARRGIHNVCAACTFHSVCEVEKSLPEGFSLPSRRGKNFHRCEQTFTPARRGQVHRKTARPFRSVYSGFTTLLRTPCTKERGGNPIRTYTRAHDDAEAPHKRIFTVSRYRAGTLSRALSRSTRRSRNEALRELGTGSERKSNRLLLDARNAPLLFVRLVKSSAMKI